MNNKFLREGLQWKSFFRIVLERSGRNINPKKDWNEKPDLQGHAQILRKHLLQNLKGFGLFETVEMNRIVIQKDFQQDLTFDSGEDFLVGIKFQVQ